MTEARNDVVEIPVAADSGVPPESGASIETQSAATSRAPDRLRPLPDDAVIILPVRNLVLFPGRDHAGHGRP
jgi:hypothetical protein